MQQFPQYSVIGNRTLPKDFKCVVGEPVECSFTAHHEFDIDAVITALIAIRSVLRNSTEPLPKNVSLVVNETQ